MDKLPDELLCRIFSYDPYVGTDPTHPICDSVRYRQQLLELSLVCKRFARIATSLLYADCFPVVEDPLLQLRMLTGLLRTLMTHPDLGNLVQHLHLGEFHHHSPDLEEAIENEFLTPLSEDELSDFCRCAPALGSWSAEYRSDFWDDLRDTEQDSMTAATLALLPNLRSLKIDMRYRMLNDEAEWWKDVAAEYQKFATIRLIELAAASPSHEPSVLGHLSSVELNGHVSTSDNDLGGWDICVLSVILKLPSLKKFVGYGCLDAWDDAPWVCDDGVSKVTYIHLDECKIGADSIRKILRSCRALETFKCRRWAEIFGHHEIPCDYSYAEIHHDLLRHRESLRYLHLSNKADACPPGDLHMENHPIEFTCFAALKALEELEVDEDIVYGCESYETRPLAKLLPPKAKRITIWANFEEHLEALFIEIQRALLSNRKLPTMKVECMFWDGEAANPSEKLTGVSIQRASRSSFMMSRLDD